MEDKIYVFGHKKPDTDATTSAIALSYLKNKLGFNTEARILGELNKETKYALDYFKVEEPVYLNDVKLQLKDIGYHKNCFINGKESIFETYEYMLKENLTGMPIVNDNEEFLGLITMKDLIHSFITNESNHLYTSYQNVLDTIKGSEVVKIDEEVVGELLVAGYSEETFVKNIELDENKILIVGNRHGIIEHAIKKGTKLIIVTGDLDVKAEHINLARDNKVNLIRSPYDSFHVTKLITLANYIKLMIRNKETTNFDENEYIENILDINEKLRHTNYPVVDKSKKCLGLLQITDLNSKNPKKVILVDHNEKLQTADGIDEAEIVEIIDHHNLGSITTSQPINFRNMAVGSSCTIVYTLFIEKKIEIPKEIAGMLLSGILSDTLILKSPTATETDKEAVVALANIAGVNYEEYGFELLKAGTSLDGMEIEDVLYNDYKLFNVEDHNFAIGQFFTMNFSEIESDIDEYIKVMNQVAEKNDYSLVALYVTDIIKNGSYIIYNEKAQDIVDMAYDKEIHEGEFIENCVSRKKNIVPLIRDVLEN